jgi:predicted nucleotide-binding protein
MAGPSPSGQIAMKLSGIRDAIYEILERRLHAPIRFKLVIEGPNDRFGKGDVATIVKRLKKVARDRHLKVVRIEPGSVKLLIEGTSKGLGRVASLDKSGNLERELGVETAHLDAGLVTVGVVLHRAYQYLEARSKMLARDMLCEFRPSAKVCAVFARDAAQAVASIRELHVHVASIRHFWASENAPNALERSSQYLLRLLDAFEHEVVQVVAQKSGPVPRRALAKAAMAAERIAQECQIGLHEIAQFLKEATAVKRKERTKPLVFISSSAEGLPIAKELQKALETELHAAVWSDQGIFTPGRSILESLQDAARSCDFAVFVLSAGDKGRLGKSVHRVRDNVIFELGMFLGSLSSKRVFVVSDSRIVLPSDLAGIVFFQYDRKNRKSVDVIAARIKEALRNGV